MTSNAIADTLLALSEAIEHAARQSDWTEAARLTQQRSPLLMSLSADADEATRAVVQRVRQIDAAVLALAAEGKSELEAGYFKAMHRASVTSEYHRVARF
ncbi:flagellar protein FliT [Paraburkholderia sp. BCC1886]|uniref:flagellar protein FliT n=1 Tax=Paraburkholderia sp. BCC1886 TaxID=2562670 RepID=UPI001183E218|nr:flagellar protein FliT [Paraburkholderia sp. BCC1886]